MIHIIHGDDIVASRNRFLEEKTGITHAVFFEGEKIEQAELANTLSSTMLFGELESVFISELFSKKKQSKDLAAVIDLLQKTDTQVIVWESKSLTPKQLASLPKARVTVYKLPQLLFAFLDNLKPGNGERLIVLFHQLLQQTEVEMVFHMIVRQFRILLALSDSNAAEVIDEVRKLSPWQQKKLISQASLFSQEALIAHHQKLFTIDLSAKTGNASLQLTQAIDFFLLDL